MTIPTHAPVHWWTLTRFDDPDPDPDPSGATPDGDPADGGPSDDDQPDDAGQPDQGRADDQPAGDTRVQYWRQRARDNERRAKANAAAAKRLAQIEDQQKSETERLTDRAKQAEDRASAALSRAVRAEVKALAVDQFADPSDAEAAIDPAAYLTEDGEVDTDGITARLADLLEAKPHWRKPEAPPPPPTPKPKPDPSQGPRGDTAPVDYRNADRDTFAAKLGEYGLRPRS